MHCVSAPITETYLCYSLGFSAIRLRLGVNNSDTQTNGLLAWENCTFSIVFRFISVSDSLLIGIQQFYILELRNRGIENLRQSI